MKLTHNKLPQHPSTGHGSQPQKVLAGLPAFIQAWKYGDKATANMGPTNSKPVQDVFWYHTLIVDADCRSDPFTKLANIETATEDPVSGIVLVAKGKTNLIAVDNVGSKQFGKQTLVENHNNFKVKRLDSRQDAA